MDTKEKIAPGRKQPPRAKGWLIAFLIPFGVAFMLGLWAGWNDLEGDSGKFYTDFKRTPGTPDYIGSAVEGGLLFGITAGVLGLVSFTCYLAVRKIVRTSQTTS